MKLVVSEKFLNIHNNPVARVDFMKNKYLAFSAIIAILLYTTSCVAPQQQPVAPPPKTEVESNQPASAPTVVQPKGEITDEVSDLLAKSKTRVQSIFYKYKGPETGDNFYDFYIRGAKIKYNPHLPIKTLDKPESYDAIFIDRVAGTAQSYCVATHCVYKGKKQDLKYEDVYIQTVFDWIANLTTAKKVGEEVIDDRTTWKVDTNKGTLWIDTFYGIPLKVEANGKIYRFQQIAVNSVQDSDVMPS